jgi:hypothetical protein
MAKWSHPYKQVLSDHASDWKEASREDRKSIVKTVEKAIVSAHHDMELSEPLPSELSKVSTMKTLAFNIRECS